MDMKNNNHDKPLIDGMDSIPEEAFLHPKPSEQFRSAVLSQTVGVIRKRTRNRRVLQAAALLLVYCAGVVTSSLFSRSDPFDERYQAKTEIKSEQKPDPDDLIKKSEKAPSPDKVRMLKQAGDIYLCERSDVENAFACYSDALDNMVPSEVVEISPSDTWLLAALKSGRK